MKTSRKSKIKWVQTMGRYFTVLNLLATWGDVRNLEFDRCYYGKTLSAQVMVCMFTMNSEDITGLQLSRRRSIVNTKSQNAFWSVQTVRKTPRKHTRMFTSQHSTVITYWIFNITSWINIPPFRKMMITLQFTSFENPRQLKWHVCAVV